MAGKKVNIGTKPRAKTQSPDEWVANRGNDGGKTKRLTIDVSPDLHKSLKLESVQQGVTMADILRRILEERYGL